MHEYNTCLLKLYNTQCCNLCCFAEFMFADAATYCTYTAQDDNVHFQQNPAYATVYFMRPKSSVYHE